jgi:hypothetical protein
MRALPFANAAHKREGGGVQRVSAFILVENRTLV